MTCYRHIILFLVSLLLASCGLEDVPPVPDTPDTPEVPDVVIPDVPSDDVMTWDESYFYLPEPSDDGWIHITRPEELAFLLHSGTPSATKVKLDRDMDMSYMPESVSDALTSAEAFFMSLTLDGAGHKVSNFKAGAFLPSASDLRVRDLVIEESVISSGTSAGAVVNTLKGSAEFVNISVIASSVNASYGNAGGIAGTMSRMSEQDRSEETDVSFQGCSVVSSSVCSSGATGVMVGFLNGYDYRERLSFDEECSASDVTLTEGGGIYAEGNESQWQEDVDFSQFDNFLGDEKYKRGTVMYGESRFVPQWDGNSQVQPLEAEPDYDGWPSGTVIYSAFDLASLQGKSCRTGGYYLLADVDMGGDEGIVFQSISDITSINGVKKERMSVPQEDLSSEDNHTVYNVKVVMPEHVYPGAAFILCAVEPDTRHMNLNFVGADIYNGINLQEGDLQYGNAYAGTLISMVESDCTYTAVNVHCCSGVVEAVCKMGGLIGHVCGDSDVINCSVHDYVIRNSRTGIVEEYKMGPVYAESNLYQAYGSQWWYTEGDAGGLIGFIAAIKVGDAYIKDCSVTDTKIDCYGSEDKHVPISVYIWRKENYISGPEGFYFLAEFSTLVAGRHVNQFIGAIDSDFSSDMFVIEDYHVSGNTYFGVPADSTDDYSHQYAQGSYCEALGCAYYIGLDIVIAGVDLGHFGNYPGTLKFRPRGGEWTIVTEAPGDGMSMAWTGGGLEL